MIFAFDNIRFPTPNVGFIALLIAVVIGACNTAKYVPANKAILKENTLSVEEPTSKDLKKSLIKLCKQEPNKKLFFVFNLRPYFYFKGSKGTDNFIKRIERNVLGEPPIFADTLFIETTTKSMTSYLKAKGYYYAKADYQVETNRKKRARVHYSIQLNKQYKIGEIALLCEDKNIQQILEAEAKNSFIGLWRPIETANLLKEQERIVNLLRNNGYYQMGKEFIDFTIDTNGYNGYCFVGINIENPSETEQHHKFYNYDVTIEIEANNQTDRGLLRKDTMSYRTYWYKPKYFKINPEILDMNLLIRPNSEFKQFTLNRTYGRLSDLGIFRFINIQTTTFQKNDSSFIHYNFRMIPTVKYSLTVEPQATYSDQNNLLTAAQDSRNYGVALLTQFTNRNVFSNAEILQLSFRSAFEAQGQNKTPGFFNSTEQKLTAAIIMPRTLIFRSFDRNEKYISNKTVFSASAIYEYNIDYIRQVFTTGINYQLNRKLTTLFFWPFEASFIRSNIRSEFLSRESENDIFLQNLFNNSLIFGTRLGFVYSNKQISKTGDFVYIRWDLLELAGYPMRIANLITPLKTNEDGAKTLFDVRYFEYAKTTLDIRYNYKIDVNNSAVFRMLGGYAFPFGNTPDFVPFEKRYFVGGANDLRGWQPRSLGPGGYRAANQLDYSGEIKLMANAEYRFNVYNRWLESAIFFDAGNVWNVNKNVERPWGEFQFNRFYKEIAFNTGLGLRLNFEIFIIRFDFALPLHDPTKPEGERWVARNINTTWVRDNFNFNFGIGYPF